MTVGPVDGTETPREELSRRLRALFKAAGMSTVRADQLLRERGIASSQSKVSRTINGRTAADRPTSASSTTWWLMHPKSGHTSSNSPRV